MKKDLEKRSEWRAQLNKGIIEGSIDLPEALKLLRKTLGKSQIEYAEMVGVSKKVVVDFELGKGNPTITTLNRLFAPMGYKAGLVRKVR